MPKATRRKQRTPAQRTRRKIAIGGSIALVLGVVAVALMTLYIGNRALIAKDSLTAAQGQLTSFKTAIGQPNAPSTTQLYQGLQANTSKAAQQVDDPVWSLYEHLPVVGPNLKAFAQTTNLIDALVHDGVGPIAKAADGISVDSLKPKNGAIDIAPLKKLTPAVGDLDGAIQAANTSAKAIDTTDVLPQLQQPIDQLRSMLGEAAPTVAEMHKIMPVLYPALGGEGKRHYLLMFQNNAEERASGGNPASMAMLVIDDGKVKLGRQGDSGDFPKLAEPILTPKGSWNKDWSKFYGVYAGEYVTNITMTPDFPTTAQMARKMWQRVYGGKVDGVISFDPVALSYLMKATGPVTLADKTTIDANNAVQFLLSDVYAKYTVPAQQDLVFASAAQGIFTAVTGGAGSPQAYLGQLKPMLAEQRLKMWSTRSDEQALLEEGGLANMLPKDNTDKTVLGVYNNDDATSKMSYYMDEQVKVTTSSCQATPKYTVSAKVINTLKPADAYSLPEYVKAHQKRIAAGGDRQWVQLYGPVGAKLQSVTIDGEKVVWGTNYLYADNTNYSATGIADRRPAVKGQLYDRPVGQVSLNIDAGTSKTVKAVFTGGTAPSATVEVSHTPKVREVPVEIVKATCS